MIIDGGLMSIRQDVDMVVFQRLPYLYYLGNLDNRAMVQASYQARKQLASRQICL